MASASKQLNPASPNTELPFITSSTWQLAETDKGNVVLGTFDWIQAFFDATAITVPAQLAIYGGHNFENGDPILSLVRFAYSGERIPVKGLGIYATGLDKRGMTVTSTVIGASATTDLSQVIAYGGLY